MKATNEKWTRYGEVTSYQPPELPKVTSPDGIKVRKIVEITRLLSPSQIAASFDVSNKNGKKEGLEYLAYLGCQSHMTHHLLQMAMIDYAPILVNNASATLLDSLNDKKKTASDLKFPLRNTKENEVRKAAEGFYRLSEELKIRKGSNEDLFEPPAYYWHLMALKVRQDYCKVQDWELKELVGVYTDKIIESKPSIASTMNTLEKARLVPIDRNFDRHLDLSIMPYLIFYGLMAFSLESTSPGITTDRFYKILSQCISKITPSYESGKLDRDGCCDTIFEMIAQKLKRKEMKAPTFVSLKEYLQKIADAYNKIQRRELLQGRNNGLIDMNVDVYAAASSSKPTSLTKVIQALRDHIGFIVSWKDEEQTRKVAWQGCKGYFFFELLRWNLLFQAACKPFITCPLRGCENVGGSSCSECAGKFFAGTARKLREECNIVSMIHNYYPYFLDMQPSARDERVLTDG